MVYLFLADGFEEVEALTPVDLLRRAGIAVTIVGLGGETATGARGVRVFADCCIDDLSGVDDAEALVIPGGYPGYEVIRKSEQARALTESCVKNGTLIAAICGAPSVLAAWGLLECKRATVYPDLKQKLGERYTKGPVVLDGRFLTADAAGSATAFSLKLISVLKGNEAAKKVADSICYFQEV